MAKNSPFELNPHAMMETRRPTLMSHDHRHHNVEVNYIRKGTIYYRHKGELIAFQEDNFCFFWAGIPHQLVKISEECLVTWINIPMHIFLQWNLTPEFKSNLLQGVIFKDVLKTDESILYEWERNSKDPNFPLDFLLTEIESRIKRVELKNKTIKPEKQHSLMKGLDKINQACYYCSLHFDKEISLDEIAEEVKLHPNYLMNLFKKEMGCSVIQYITKLRIAKSQRLLATTDLKVLDIAYQSGFSTPSRFYKAFEADVGVSPKIFRRQVKMQ